MPPRPPRPKGGSTRRRPRGPTGASSDPPYRCGYETKDEGERTYRRVVAQRPSPPAEAAPVCPVIALRPNGDATLRLLPNAQAICDRFRLFAPSPNEYWDRGVEP